MFFQRFNVPVCPCNSRGEKWMHYCNGGKLFFKFIMNLFTCLHDLYYFCFLRHPIYCRRRHWDFIFFFRYNRLKILFTVNIGFLVDCLHMWRDWDYLNASCCSWKLDNWTEPVCFFEFNRTKTTNLCENVKTEKTAGNNELSWLVDAPLIFFSDSNPCPFRASSPKGFRPLCSCLHVD